MFIGPRTVPARAGFFPIFYLGTNAPRTARVRDATLSPAHAQIHSMMNALMLLVSASAHLLPMFHRSSSSSCALTPTMVDPEIQLPPGVPIVDLSLDVRARRKGGLGWGPRGV